ncbi:MAG: FAD-dependent oxidoreductase [Chloroflexi bacterium]|nr:FAD-dependent oxidoreductase [Chloroflexota bacterium]
MKVLPEIPVEIAGLRFRNPFYVASGPTTKSVRQLQRIEETGWAGASIKLTIDPDPYINRKPRYGWLKGRNALAFTTEKRLKFSEGLKLVEDAKKVLKDLIVMANITYAGEDNPDGWVRMAKRFEETGADIIELNMCCPNMSYNLEITDKEHASKQKTGASMGQQPAVASEIVRAVKSAIKIPLFVKLTPEGGQIAAVAKSLYAVGADAVGSTGNRLGIPTIDLSRPTKSNFTLQDQISIGCYSSSWLKPLAQRDIYEMRKVNGNNVFITATGGITSWQDAVEMVMCGGSLLGICAETLINGFDILEPIVKGMKSFMDEHGFETLDDYRSTIVPEVKSSAEVTIYDGYAQIINPQLAAPCKIACPLHVPAQAYVQKVAKRQFKDAFDLIMAHPLQEICSLICSHPCEDVCTRANVDTSIQIRDIKRFVLELGLKNGWNANASDERLTSTKIAVVGSGPSGLAAASSLASAGYQVTVFERESELGGHLRYGTGRFRLPVATIDRLITKMREQGVRFKTKVTVGTDIQVRDLMAEGFECVLLAIGTEPAQPMKAEPGVKSMSGAQYLYDAYHGAHAPHDCVIVVGGNLEATDCARTAIRQGSSEVYLVLESMPKGKSAFKAELAQAKAEGVVVLENTSLDGAKDGLVALVNADRFTRELQCDLLVFAGDTKPNSSSELIRLGDMQVVVNKDGVTTSLPKLFAAGGVVKPGELANLIASGRNAAVVIDQALRADETKLKQQPRLTRADLRLVMERTPLPVGKVKPLDLNLKPAKDLLADFDLTRRVMTEEEAVAEASRCLNCGCGEGCQLCKTICCEFAPYISSPDELQINKELCVACGMCAMRCPQGNIEMVNLGISRT